MKSDKLNFNKFISVADWQLRAYTDLNQKSYALNLMEGGKAALQRPHKLTHTHWLKYRWDIFSDN